METNDLLVKTPEILLQRTGASIPDAPSNLSDKLGDRLSAFFARFKPSDELDKATRTVSRIAVEKRTTENLADFAVQLGADLLYWQDHADKLDKEWRLTPENVLNGWTTRAARKNTISVRADVQTRSKKIAILLFRLWTNNKCLPKLSLVTTSRAWRLLADKGLGLLDEGNAEFMRFWTDLCTKPTVEVEKQYRPKQTKEQKLSRWVQDTIDKAQKLVKEHPHEVKRILSTLEEFMKIQDDQSSKKTSKVKAA